MAGDKNSNQDFLKTASVIVLIKNMWVFLNIIPRYFQRTYGWSHF